MFAKINAFKGNLRQHRKFSTRSRSITTIHYGTESIAFLVPKIWKIVPENIKASMFIAEFKTKLRNWIPTNCPCRTCRIF